MGLREALRQLSIGLASVDIEMYEAWSGQSQGISGGLDRPMASPLLGIVFEQMLFDQRDVCSIRTVGRSEVRR